MSLDNTPLRECRLHRLEGFLLCTVVAASYGGAWLVEAFCVACKRGSTVQAFQGRSL
jgi:hypothetical protein